MDFDKYADETREKWGHTAAYKEHTEKTKDYSKQKWNDLAEDMNNLMAQFALCMQSSAPDSALAQTLVKTLQNHITDNYYNCTDEILLGLGQMYVLDPRFKDNIDKHAPGTAAFIRDAISIYTNK